MAEGTKANYDEDVNKKSSTGLDPKVAILLAYLFSWLGGLIIWLIEKENKFVKWNALQALILGIVEAIIGILIMIFGWIPFIGWLLVVIGWLALVAILVAAIMAIVKAFSGETFRIPGISGLTDKYFKM